MYPTRLINTVLGLLVLLLLATPAAFAQVDTLWTRNLTLPVPSRATAVAELSSGGFAVAGYAQTGQDNAMLMSVNPIGDTSWTRVFGNPSMGDRAFDVAELANGTIVVCGFTQSQLALFVTGYDPNGVLLWYEVYDPPNSTQADAILPREDGGFWMLGRRWVQDRGADFWLFSCDENGDSLFTRTFGTDGEDVPSQMLPGDGGTLELVGSTRVPPATDNNLDFLRITVSSTAEFVRQDIVGTDLWEQVHGAARDSDTGEIIIAGERRPSTSDKDGMAVRLEEDGSVLWNRMYTHGFITERFTGAATYLDGGALFCGYVGAASESSYRLWLLAVAANGDTAWTWTGTETGRGFEDMVRTSDGGFVACGRALMSSVEHPLVWRVGPPSGISGMVRDRDTGEPTAGVRVQAASLPQYSVSDSLGRFTLSLPEGEYTIFTGGPCFSGDTLHSIDVIANENTTQDITVGVAHMSVTHTTINVLSPNHSEGSAELVVANEGSGDLVYSFEAFGQVPPGDWLSVEPASGRIAPGDTLVALVIVEADTNDEGTYDYFGEVRLHTNSCPETLRIFEVLAVILDAERAPELPSEFALYPAYPNPFNSTTRLRFGIDRDSDVSLRIFDVTGREVVTLLNNQRLTAGEHTLSFEARDMASGLYFVRLSDPTRSQTQRLLYIR